MWILSKSVRLWDCETESFTTGLYSVQVPSSVTHLHSHWSNLKISLARLFPSLTNQKILNILNGGLYYHTAFSSAVPVLKWLAHNLQRPCVITDHPQNCAKWDDEIINLKCSPPRLIKVKNFHDRIKKVIMCPKRQEMNRPCRSHRTSYHWTSLVTFLCRYYTLPHLSLA